MYTSPPPHSHAIPLGPLCKQSAPQALTVRAPPPAQAVRASCPAVSK